MNAATAIMVLQLIMGQAREFYTWAKQAHGEAIPDWDTLTQGFNDMQAKLDAEK